MMLGTRYSSHFRDRINLKSCPVVFYLESKSIIHRCLSAINSDISYFFFQTTSEYSCHQAPPPAPFFNSLGQSSSLSRYDNESRIYEEVFLTSNREGKTHIFCSKFCTGFMREREIAPFPLNPTQNI